MPYTPFSKFTFTFCEIISVMCIPQCKIIQTSDVLHQRSMHLIVADNARKICELDREPTIIDPPSAGTESAGRCIICRLARWIRSWLIAYTYGMRAGSLAPACTCNVWARSPEVVKVNVEYAGIEIIARDDQYSRLRHCDRKRSMINLFILVCIRYIFAYICVPFSRIRRKTMRNRSFSYTCYRN